MSCQQSSLARGRWLCQARRIEAWKDQNNDKWRGWWYHRPTSSLVPVYHVTIRCFRSDRKATRKMVRVVPPVQELRPPLPYSIQHACHASSKAHWYPWYCRLIGRRSHLPWHPIKKIPEENGWNAMSPCLLHVSIARRINCSISSQRVSTNSKSSVLVRSGKMPVTRSARNHAGLF